MKIVKFKTDISLKSKRSLLDNLIKNHQCVPDILKYTAKDTDHKILKNLYDAALLRFYLFDDDIPEHLYSDPRVIVLAITDDDIEKMYNFIKSTTCDNLSFDPFFHDAFCEDDEKGIFFKDTNIRLKANENKDIYKLLTIVSMNFTLTGRTHISRMYWNGNEFKKVYKHCKSWIKYSENTECCAEYPKRIGAKKTKRKLSEILKNNLPRKTTTPDVKRSFYYSSRSKVKYYNHNMSWAH